MADHVRKQIRDAVAAISTEDLIGIALVLRPGPKLSGRIEFVGSTFGGPVVMVTPAGRQMFVSESDRFGTFGTLWVRRFFGADN